MEIIKSTLKGKIICEDSLVFMKTMESDTIDLIVTSPPFDLIKEKAYGNLKGEDYLEWMNEFGKEFYRILKPSGSLVMDLGGGWSKGAPTKNLSEYRILINYVDNLKFHLAQDIFWWDPSRLPAPAQWVTVNRLRLKDAINKLWWFSKTEQPKANNKEVLQEYSDAMQRALLKGTNVGMRASGHEVSKNFHKDNGGSIPPNLLAISNSVGQDEYMNYCKDNNLKTHPARFHKILPEFFIRMLTDKDDTVFDPFAGSCVTGFVAEKLNRKWICCDLEKEYLLGAIGRFENIENKPTDKRSYEYKINAPNFDHKKNIKKKGLLIDEDQGKFYF